MPCFDASDDQNINHEAQNTLASMNRFWYSKSRMITIVVSRLYATLAGLYATAASGDL